MDPKATVQTVMDSVQKGDFAKAKSLLADDFQFSGPVPDPISGQEWMDMSKNLKAAFPDLDYQFKMEGVNGNVVNITAQLKGTHKKDLDLTAMNMGVIPATNKAFVAAKEHGKVTVQGDKVKSLANEPTEGAGMMAILGQLGVQPQTT